MRVSDALTEQLAVRDAATQLTRAGILASNLISRAETDSVELERVIRITEPELAASLSAASLSVDTEDVSIVYKKLGMNTT